MVTTLLKRYKYTPDHDLIGPRHPHGGFKNGF
jgi:hypothetical protein